MSAADYTAWLHSPAGVGCVLTITFVLGSMVGSFLNVVAHRVPRGETVVHGRSHCPACGTMIRARDNVPVLGWIFLRGRCRDCGAAISARYPLVEACCGGLAAALALAELAGTPREVPAAVAAAWAGRTALALTVVAWGLLAERGHAVSAAAVVAAAAVAALAAAFVPPLRPLAAWCGPAPLTTDAWPGCLLASVAGLLAGWVAGGGGGRPARVACATIGAALGWQAAILAALAAVGGRALGRQPAAACLATAATLLAWHPLARVWVAACAGFSAR